jgi:PPOX class probable F420-dependent enzyme
MAAADPAACRAFLLAAPRPAMLATVRADGSPHLAPVWIDLESPDTDVICFNTGAETVKGRNLAARPACALSVQHESPPYAFVTAFGAAELSEDLAEVRAWAARLGGRYMGADRAEEMGARNGVPGELLVRVRVSRWVGALDVSA